MTDAVETRNEETREEHIPRKMRDLIGRVMARMDRVEDAIEKKLRQPENAAPAKTAAANSDEPTHPAVRVDNGHKPAVERRVAHRQPVSLTDALANAAELAGLPPDIFIGIEDMVYPPESGMFVEPENPANETPAEAAPEPENTQGASSTPSTPPPAGDPELDAARRAESVETHLDSLYFGS